MYERMLNKQITPSIGEMTAYCAENIRAAAAGGYITG